MAVLIAEPAKYLERHLSGRARVLLVNPPVQERRYHWLRWNQPADLLRLSSWLKRVHPKIDVRLFDFMFPDEAGRVSRHKVKETWTGSTEDTQLWHFGRKFGEFESYLRFASADGWRPDAIVISSLTSYWHVSIEKLLVKLCLHLGRNMRGDTLICIYGNYPTFEPVHAAGQLDADVAFTKSVDTTGCMPDFELYSDAEGRLPNFFALDIADSRVVDHLRECLALKKEGDRKRGLSRRPIVTAAFFNDDVCSHAGALEQVAVFGEQHHGQVVLEGIVGMEPRSLSTKKLDLLETAGFRSVFLEHARLPGGDIDTAMYQPVLDYLNDRRRGGRVGRRPGSRLDRTNITGFVTMGLPDDDMDSLVRSTLTVNSYFQSVILKPYGYSPTLDPATPAERRACWANPYEGSPQWFPYVGRGTNLRRPDYENLLRWQNVLNKRVKGLTFDFLDTGTVAGIVRETLVAESWKRCPEVT